MHQLLQLLQLHPGIFQREQKHQKAIGTKVTRNLWSMPTSLSHFKESRNRSCGTKKCPTNPSRLGKWPSYADSIGLPAFPCHCGYVPWLRKPFRNHYEPQQPRLSLPHLLWGASVSMKVDEYTTPVASPFLYSTALWVQPSCEDAYWSAEEEESSELHHTHRDPIFWNPLTGLRLKI